MAIEHKMKNDKKYIIVGAGNYGKKLAKVIGKDKIECFADNADSKIENEILGMQVRKLDDIIKLNRQYHYIIAADYFSAIELSEQLSNNEISNYMLWFEIVPETEETKRQKRLYESMYILKNKVHTYMIELNGEILLKEIYMVSCNWYKWIEWIAKGLNIQLNIGKMEDVIREESNFQQLIALLSGINEIIFSEKLINLFFDQWTEINCMMANLNNCYKKEGFEIGKIDFMITEKCSLKCEECLNLMQYYEKPCNYDVSALYETANVFLKAVDWVYEIRILGGEPLMNPKFYEICNKFTTLKKVKKIIVFTNGTIPLDCNSLTTLNKDKIVFVISDYGIKRQIIKEIINELEETDIQYCVMNYKGDKWIRHSNFEKIIMEKAVARKGYEECKGKDCPVILKNKIYVCEYIANASNIFAIPIDGKNSVVIEKENAYLRNQIKEYLCGKDPLPGCYYCQRWLNNRHSNQYVKAARQIEKPLKFKKR